MKWEEQVQDLDLANLRRSITFLYHRYRLGEAGHSVEGLVVDTLFRSWERYDQFKPRLGSFSAWVRNWANSVCSQYWRQAKRRNIAASLDDDERYELIPHSGPSPLQWVIRCEEVAEAEVLVHKMELAIYVIEGGVKEVRTDLLVFRTYRDLLRQDDGPVTKTRVSREANLTRRTVGVSLKRIADKCRRAGLLKNFLHTQLESGV